MNALWIVIAGLLLGVFHWNPADAQQVSISIKTIESNQYISGSINGLKAADYPNYKVIVYVHTNKWYIHPVAGQDEGQSWAAIQKDGTWRIKTVRREFKADKVAALLVKRNYPEPNEIEDANFERIQRSATAVRELRETSDYGKL